MPDRAFTLIEVMIAVALLATALLALVGNIATLSNAHHANAETAKAQEIAQQLAERIQGARWSSLGTVAEPWSWFRRQSYPDARQPAVVVRGLAEPVAQPPMREDDVTTSPYPGPTGSAFYVNNLLALPLGVGGGQGLGILVERSGLEDLAVYLEYYPPGTTYTRATWTHRVLDTPQHADVFRLPTSDQALIARIVVAWHAHAGGERRYELMVARRR